MLFLKYHYKPSIDDDDDDDDDDDGDDDGGKDNDIDDLSICSQNSSSIFHITLLQSYFLVTL